MLKLIIKVLKLPYYKIRNSKLLTFILPNASKLLQERILFSVYPTCNQKTLITGEGIVEIGKNCSFGYKFGGFYRGGCIEIQAKFVKSLIKIGDRVATNNNVFLCAANLIEIGSDTLIGQYVCVMDFDGHCTNPAKRRELDEIGTVTIGKNVWIGNNVMILKNSQIGDNSIVAAGAVVTGRFPENVIIGGVPAKIIKNL